MEVGKACRVKALEKDLLEAIDNATVVSRLFMLKACAAHEYPPQLPAGKGNGFTALHPSASSFQVGRLGSSPKPMIYVERTAQQCELQYRAAYLGSMITLRRHNKKTALTQKT